MNDLRLVARWQKQPADTQDYDIDFVEWLDLVGDVPRATNPVEVIVSAGLTLVAFELIGTVVKVWLSGGTDKTHYKVSILLHTAGGRVKEADFELRVKEV